MAPKGQRFQALIAAACCSVAACGGGAGVPSIEQLLRKGALLVAIPIIGSSWLQRFMCVCVSVCANSRVCAGVKEKTWSQTAYAGEHKNSCTQTSAAGCGSHHKHVAMQLMHNTRTSSIPASFPVYLSFRLPILLSSFIAMLRPFPKRVGGCCTCSCCCCWCGGGSGAWARVAAGADCRRSMLLAAC